MITLWLIYLKDYQHHVAFLFFIHCCTWWLKGPSITDVVLWRTTSDKAAILARYAKDHPIWSQDISWVAEATREAADFAQAVADWKKFKQLKKTEEVLK